MSPESSLVLIKLLHTAIWIVLASVTAAIPFAALRGRFRLAAWLTAAILVECCVLALNQGRCPLTDLAAQFTTNRAANFDIYLPLWLAKYNQAIFGCLFVEGELVWFWQWLKRRSTQKNGVTRR